MADKEAQLRLRLTAQNEASEAFAAAEEAMRAMQGVAEQVSRLVSESLDSITKTSTEMTRGLTESTQESNAALTDMARMSGEDMRTMSEAFSSVQRALSETATAIREQTAEITAAIEEMSTRTSSSTGRIHDSSLGALIAIQMLGDSMEHLGQAGEHLFDFAIQQGADFQQSMKNIQVAIAANNDSTTSWNAKMAEASGITSELQQKALELGSRGAQSANEVAEAMDTMIRSGVDAKAVLGGAAESAQNVAIVTGDSLDEAASLITEVYHQFREEFANNGKSIQENMKQTGDVISGVLLSARISSTDFLNTLKYVGPVASQMGSNLDDAAVATALLAQNGIKGSQAGTALRRVFTNLLEPTKAGAQAMEKLGLIINGQNQLIDQHTGKLKSLTEIQAILHKSLEGLTDAKKAEYIHDIFGQYALAGSLVLAKENADAYDELKRKIDGVNSTTAAASMLDTFNGHMKQLEAHVQTTAKEFGMSFIPVLEKLIPIGNSVLNFLQHMSPQTKTLLMGVLALGSAMAIAGGALMTFGIYAKFAGEGVAALKALFGWEAMVTRLGSAFTFITNPWVLLVGAVVAGVALIVTHWQQIVDFVQQHFGISIPGVLHSLLQVFQDVWNGIRNAITAVWNFVGPYIMSAVTAVANFWKAVWPQLQQVFSAVWNAIKAIIEPYITLIKSLISLNLTIIKATWHDAWNAILSVLKAIWDAITGVIRTAWDLVTGIFKVALDLLTGHWSKAWTDMKTMLGNLWNDIKNLFSNIVNDMYNFGANMIKMLGDGIMSGIHWVEHAVSSVASTIKSFLGFHSPTEAGPASDSDQWAPNFVNMFAGSLESGAGRMTDAVRTLVNPLTALKQIGVNVNAGLSSNATGATGALSALGGTASMALPRGGAVGGGNMMQVGQITIQINGAGKDGTQLGQDIMQYIRQQMSMAV